MLGLLIHSVPWRKDGIVLQEDEYGYPELRGEAGQDTDLEAAGGLVAPGCGDHLIHLQNEEEAGHDNSSGGPQLQHNLIVWHGQELFI